MIDSKKLHGRLLAFGSQSLTLTSSSAVTDKPTRRAELWQTGKILKKSHNHNHASFVGDMSSCC